MLDCNSQRMTAPSETFQHQSSPSKDSFLLIDKILAGVATRTSELMDKLLTRESIIRRNKNRLSSFPQDNRNARPYLPINYRSNNRDQRSQAHSTCIPPTSGTRILLSSHRPLPRQAPLKPKQHQLPPSINLTIPPQNPQQLYKQNPTPHTHLDRFNPLITEQREPRNGLEKIDDDSWDIGRTSIHPSISTTHKPNPHRPSHINQSIHEPSHPPFH